MPSLLVILLTISLVVVVAGLLLSYKPYVRYARSQRYVPADYIGRPVIVVDSLPARTRPMVQSKQLVVRSSPMEIERYAGASLALPYYNRSRF